MNRPSRGEATELLPRRNVVASNIFRKVAVVLGISVILLGMLAAVFYSEKAVLAQAATSFSDVAENHPFAGTIQELKARGLVKGYGDNTFAPDSSVTRAEFITMVVAGITDKPYGSNCFKDVKNEWFAKFVCYARTKGFVKGYGDGTFKPNNNINFAEASAIYSKAYKLQAGTAVKGEPWYKPSVLKMGQKAAIPVTIDYVNKKISRAETGEMVLRLKTKTEDRPTKTYESLTAKYPAVSSCAELKEKFAAFSYSQTKNRRNYLMEGGVMAPMPMMSKALEAEGEADMAAPTAEGEGPAADFSSTNVQVEGVDEADVIKNDGEFIYMVNRNTIRIVKAYPPQGLQEVSRQEFAADTNFNPQEIYVTPSKLLVIGSSYGMNTEGRYGSRTKVYIFNMDSVRKLTEQRSLEFDGNQVSSRRIGNRLYLVMNDYPDYYRVLEGEVSPDKVLPRYKVSAGVDTPLAGCSEIHFLPQYDDIGFTVVAGIDIENPSTPISKEVIMGGGDTVYASTKSLYVAGTRYEYPEVMKFDVFMPPQTNQKTVIFRFNLEDNGDVIYKTQGEVKGVPLNQFSMDEEGSAFRIATTTGEVWNSRNPSKNHLFILDKTNLSNVLGKIENIAPGEKIYSVRFLGKRMYMVTFKKVDPFFVIDVEDPRNPRILGQLKIPGFSDYLHPFDENHIIGFGKEAVDPTELDQAGFNRGEFDFAWYQGMKIALFDVTDVANPKMMFKEVIGDRGTDSEVLHNHKALLYDKARSLFAFPVTVAQIKDKSSGSYTGSQYGETVFQGAYVYTLDLQNGFKLKGTITHYDDPSIYTKAGYYWYEDKNTIKRIVEIGDYLYSVSLGKIKAVRRSDMIEVKAAELEVTDDQVPVLYMK